MKLAAIDIGSNAIRLQISTVLEGESGIVFKKLEYVRFPLRLGHDVFTSSRISQSSAIKFKKLMTAYKLLLDLYEVDDYMFCATSAIRESENGKEIVQQVKEEIGITIHIIDGNMEANLINKAIYSYLGNETYLHIDVGGGSTELNLFAQGKKIRTHSFKIGSVRILENNDSPQIWNEMEKWVQLHVKPSYGKISAVGTGGNISKIFELTAKKTGTFVSVKKVKSILEMIEKLSINERIYKLQMNPDRADVIIPAGKIYLKVMAWAHARKILIPDVGLKDGILMYLLEKK